MPPFSLLYSWTKALSSPASAKARSSASVRVSAVWGSIVLISSTFQLSLCLRATLENSSRKFQEGREGRADYLLSHAAGGIFLSANSPEPRARFAFHAPLLILFLPLCCGFSSSRLKACDFKRR